MPAIDAEIFSIFKNGKKNTHLCETTFIFNAKYVLPNYCFVLQAVSHRS